MTAERCFPGAAPPVTAEPEPRARERERRRPPPCRPPRARRPSQRSRRRALCAPISQVGKLRTRERKDWLKVTWLDCGRARARTQRSGQ